MKTCTKCGEAKEVNCFPWIKATGRHNTRCKVCVSEQAKIRNARRDKEALRLAAADFRQRHPDYKAQQRAYLTRQCRDLAPGYVAKALRLPSVSLLTPELFEMKREQLRLHRLAKQMEQAATKAKEE